LSAPADNFADSALLVVRWNHCGDLQYVGTCRPASHLAN
jgi:hypothetical protein